MSTLPGPQPPEPQPPSPQPPGPQLPERVDAVVVGAGASGLSLVCHLAASPWGAQHDVLVVDDGAYRPADRAWAYWSTGDGLLDHLAWASFDRFWVHGAGRSHRSALSAYRYLAVRGEDLIRTARERTTPPRFRHVTGRVLAIHEEADGARVVIGNTTGTEPARTVRARWVFDSTGQGGRPGPPPARTGRLEFRGHRVEVPSDAFDPAAPTLMDFRTDQKGSRTDLEDVNADQLHPRTGSGLAFVYVLPESPRVALVEHTRFVVGAAAAAHPAPDQADAVDAYLREVLGLGEHRVLAVEQGAIPLATHAARLPTAHVVPIGTPAGMVKASTGYGFGRIQRHGAALARSLTAHGHPFDVPRPSRRHRHLDALLLDVVAHEPQAVVEAFTRMFARNAGDRVLAFLDEDTSLAQELALILTLPPAPFLRRLAGLAWGHLAGIRAGLARAGRAFGPRRPVTPGSAPTADAARRPRDPGSRST